MTIIKIGSLEINGAHTLAKYGNVSNGVLNRIVCDALVIAIKQKEYLKNKEKQQIHMSFEEFNPSVNSGLAFDKETYEKAKPLFKAALADFKDARDNIREAMRTIIRMLLDKFGAEAIANMKPYVVQFIKDVQSGVEVIDEQPASYLPEGWTEATGEIPVAKKSDFPFNL